MSYRRVIPRDLFNESKLLKCLGKLYIESENEEEGKIVLDHYGAPFAIEQDPSSGSIYVSKASMAVIVNDRDVHLYTTLNSRYDWPLYCDYKDETVAVFNEDGTLTQEFLKVGL